MLDCIIAKYTVYKKRLGSFSLNQNHPFTFLYNLISLVVNFNLKDEKSHVGAFVLSFLNKVSRYSNSIAKLYCLRETPVLKPHKSDCGQSLHGEPKTRCD